MREPTASACPPTTTPPTNTASTEHGGNDGEDPAQVMKVWGLTDNPPMIAAAGAPGGARWVC